MAISQFIYLVEKSKEHVNAKDEIKNFPLNLAIKSRNESLVRLLIKKVPKFTATRTLIFSVFKHVLGNLQP